MAKEKKPKAPKPVKQIADGDEQETLLLIDYEQKKLKIYSNRATVINRLDKLGHEAIKVDYYGKKICSKTYEFPSTEIPKFLRSSIFKFD